MERAGADALELNFSCPHGMPEQGLGSAIGQDPEITGTITRWVKEAVKIPVIVKLSPNVTDIQIIARAAVGAGADMLAAINTVQCLIGVDLDSLDPVPSVDGHSTFGGYSGYAIKPIGLRCVAQMAQSVTVPITGHGWDLLLARCGGIPGGRGGSGSGLHRGDGEGRRHHPLLAGRLAEVPGPERLREPRAARRSGRQETRVSRAVEPAVRGQSELGCSGKLHGVWKMRLRRAANPAIRRSPWKTTRWSSTAAAAMDAPCAATSARQERFR